MLEIYGCLFDLSQLFKLFTRQDKTIEDNVENYEKQTQKHMAENRLKLFAEYGYNSEFENAFT